MSRARRALAGALLLVGLALTSPVGADDIPQEPRAPHIGYAYPGGGQVGTTLKVSIGGQRIQRAHGVHVSGEGVTARVRFWFRLPPNLDGNQRRELRRRLQKARDRLQGVVTAGDERPGRGRRSRPARRAPKDDEPAEPVEMPDHPLIERLPELDLEELQETERLFFIRRSQLQRKQSIEETVKLEVTIAPDAEPGVREIRLLTRDGLSNPLRFRVGLLPEVRELEPNAMPGPEAPVLSLPATVNGQILPRDTDRFRFRAARGQRLVCRAEARGLVPYQADSVPGWMQTILTLYDAEGREVAYADEFRFDPDPVLFYEVEDDGVYELEIADAIARGREDFVYRVSIGELPFVTRVFPLGGQSGKLIRAEVAGWNLGWTQVPLDTRPASHGVRETAWRTSKGPTNEITYAVGTLPEILEEGPNDDTSTAPSIELPVVVNGRIEKPGDVDVFAFRGRLGEEVVVEVQARRLGSPVDSLVRVLDEDGQVLAWNDDFRREGLGVRGLGLQTHDADSYVRARLPKTGTYYVRLTDVCRHGSADHVYRLRVSPPRPDVQLFVNPSAVNLRQGRASVIAVRAVRIDGYDGPVRVRLEGAPKGLELGGGRIPPGRERVLMTLTAPRGKQFDPFPLKLVGELEVGGETQERLAQPADNLMQAFLWRHIVPAKALLATTARGGSGGVPILRVADAKPTRVSQGGKGRVRFEVDGRLPRGWLKRFRFQAFDGPEGVTLGEARPTGGGFTLEIKASKDAVRSEAVDNLIVQVFQASTGQEEASRRARRRQQFPLGYLPAIPFRISR